MVSSHTGGNWLSQQSLLEDRLRSHGSWAIVSCRICVSYCLFLSFSLSFLFIMTTIIKIVMSKSYYYIILLFLSNLTGLISSYSFCFSLILLIPLQRSVGGPNSSCIIQFLAGANTASSYSIESHFGKKSL